MDVVKYVFVGMLRYENTPYMPVQHPLGPFETHEAASAALMEQMGVLNTETGEKPVRAEIERLVIWDSRVVAGEVVETVVPRRPTKAYFRYGYWAVAEDGSVFFLQK